MENEGIQRDMMRVICIMLKALGGSFIMTPDELVEVDLWPRRVYQEILANGDIKLTLESSAEEADGY